MSGGQPQECKESNGHSSPTVAIPWGSADDEGSVEPPLANPPSGAAQYRYSPAGEVEEWDEPRCSKATEPRTQATEVPHEGPHQPMESDTLPPGGEHRPAARQASLTSLASSVDSMPCCEAPVGEGAAAVPGLNLNPKEDSFVVGEFREKHCPICLERYTDSNPAIFYDCNHAFHLQCADAWYQRNRSCPVCLQKNASGTGRLMTPRDIKRTRTPRGPSKSSPTSPRYKDMAGDEEEKKGLMEYTIDTDDSEDDETQHHRRRRRSSHSGGEEGREEEGEQHRDGSADSGTSSGEGNGRGTIATRRSLLVKVLVRFGRLCC